jgi:hypothetical protein
MMQRHNNDNSIVYNSGCVVEAEVSGQEQALKQDYGVQAFPMWSRADTDDYPRIQK